MTPLLRTPRLALQPVSLDHAPDLQRHFADWEVIRHLSVAVPWPYPDDGVATFFEADLLPRIAAGHAHAWALVPDEADEAVGLLEWRCAPDTTDSRGFWISRAWQGRGLMTEAVTAFQDWVFFDQQVDALTLHSAVRNAASRRVKEKTGAVIVETVQVPHHEGVTDTHRWRLTRAAWASFRGRT